MTQMGFCFAWRHNSLDCHREREGEGSDRDSIWFLLKCGSNVCMCVCVVAVVAPYGLACQCCHHLRQFLFSFFDSHFYLCLLYGKRLTQRRPPPCSTIFFFFLVLCLSFRFPFTPACLVPRFVAVRLILLPNFQLWLPAQPAQLPRLAL